MSAWVELGLSEYSEVWNEFTSRFKFAPSMDALESRGYTPPKPFQIYDISKVSISKYDSDYIDQEFMNIFMKIVPIGGYIYALDWHHDSYRVYVHEGSDPWYISIYPDRDYHIFLSSDMSFGIIGHPWMKTVCVFGEELLGEIIRFDHRMFRSIIEQSS
ncbi:MAG: DUF2716 domain-containing protein [Chloroflexi bacterium]|nr:DUF2716 domain-containing protein [Chloroflexota bacterium]